MRPGVRGVIKAAFAATALTVAAISPAIAAQNGAPLPRTPTVRATTGVGADVGLAAVPKPRWASRSVAARTRRCRRPPASSSSWV